MQNGQRPLQNGQRPGLRNRQTTVQSRSRKTSVSVTALLRVADNSAARWEQTRDALTLRVSVPDNVKGRDVKLEVHRKRMVLSVRGDVVVEGTYDHPTGVDPDGSFFEMEDAPAGAEDRVVVVTLAKQEVASTAMGYEPWDRLLESDIPDKTITHRVYMDIDIDGQRAGCFVFGLYGKVVPRTVQNFRALCTGERGRSASSGVALSYAGSSIFRVLPSLMIVGGDIVRNDGSNGESIYGGKFGDENFALQHEGEGVLSMCDFGPNSNTSQFQISCGQYPFLDGKHVVFGRILNGLVLLRKIETLPRREADRPAASVTIAACGELSPSDYEALLPTLEPEPQPRNLSFPSLDSLAPPSSSSSSMSPSQSGAFPSQTPPSSPSSGKKGAAAIGGDVTIDADALLRRLGPDAFDLDAPGGGGGGFGGGFGGFGGSKGLR